MGGDDRPAGSPPCEPNAGRGVRAARVLRFGEAGQRDETDLGRRVVGREQGLEFVFASLRRQRPAQRADDPDRMREAQAETLIVGTGRGRDGLQPLLRRPCRDLAQHPVREAGRAAARAARASSTDSFTAACVATRVCEQLVRAEPEHVEHRRVDLVDVARRPPAR